MDIKKRVEIVVSGIKQLMHLTKASSATDNDKTTATLTFLSEQIQLLFATRKRYSPDSLLTAFKLYCSSRATYNLLRSSCLTLPHTSHLRQLMSCFSQCGTALSDDDAHFVFLKQKCTVLPEHERLCILMLDEIYVNAKVTYKGGALQGFAENSASEPTEATTVQAFMLSSILSKHKDVAALLPVKNMDSGFLYDSTLKVLNLVEKAGFKVVAIISDNNRVNRNMFEKMCGGTLQPYIPHPCDPQRSLFFLFDAVHLLKCIRNNWINQIDQTFNYPDLNTVGLWSKASFAHLKQLYDSEQTAAAKLAPGLTYSALHPNNLQRQNVNLALKIFDEKNVAALSEFGKSINADLSGTQNFIAYIVQLWKIVNVKHPQKGQRLNDPFREPVTDVNDTKLLWLESCYGWLCAWENAGITQRHGILSKETHFALKHTVQTMCYLSRYLLGHHNLTYVLLGKFQTDKLEFHFGLYRQMSGANYNVSVTQIMESEKKLKVMGIMRVVTCTKDRALTLRDFITGCQAELESADQIGEDSLCSTPFQSVLDECDNITIQDAEMSSLVFVAGYVGFKLKPKMGCIDCRIEFLTERALECDYPTDSSFDYLAAVDRGRLTWPTELLVDIVVQSIVVFKCLMLPKYYNQFVTAQKQRSILAELALERCKTVVLGITQKCSSCDKEITDVVKLCIKTVCNISLNNLTKRLSDVKTKSKTLRKLSTLTK